MRILLVNLHSADNAGDDVLTKVTIQQLEQTFSPVDLYLAMNDPASHTGAGQTVGSFMTWFRDNRGRWSLKAPVVAFLAIVAAVGYRWLGNGLLRFIPKRYRPLLEAYFTADLIISGAGNFLYGSGRFGFALLVAVYTMSYGWLLGKPVYMMPQTIGPLRHWWEEKVVKWGLQKCQLIFVRDEISRQLLLKIGMWHENCQLVPDLAFALAGDSRLVGEALLNDISSNWADTSPRIGVTMINWGAQNSAFTGQIEYETAVSEALRQFLTHHGGQVFLFAQVRGPAPADDDLIPAQRVFAQLIDLQDQVVLVEQPTSSTTLKAAYGCMDIFLGSRLHSNIFALCENVPAVTVQYQYKTRGIMRMLELEDWVIEIEQVTTSRLLTLLTTLWLSRENVSHHLREVMPPLIDEAANVSQLIADHYADKYATEGS